jgi:hypothetical protein
MGERRCRCDHRLNSIEQFPGVPELGDDIEQFMEVARAQHWIELA